MLKSRARCWDEDALSAVSVALYLYLAFGAVHAWAHVDQVGRAVSHLLR
jgi:hypothetical protein